MAGCGQAFHMAFGLDQYDFRNFMASFMSLLRMAVGDFDYGPGRPGAVKRPSRFPMKVHFVWGFCMGAQGA